MDAMSIQDTSTHDSLQTFLHIIGGDTSTVHRCNEHQLVPLQACKGTLKGSIHVQQALGGAVQDRYSTDAKAGS